MSDRHHCSARLGSEVGSLTARSLLSNFLEDLGTAISRYNAGSLIFLSVEL